MTPNGVRLAAREETARERQIRISREYAEAHRRDDACHEADRVFPDPVRGIH
ncbi:MAG: hypothetical protein AAFR16_03140 [Pseudomonadota bacterium]